MIFEDSSDEEAQNDGEEDSEEEDTDNAPQSPPAKARLSIAAPSPLVLRAVNRNQYDGYIKRTKEQAQKVGRRLCSC